MSPRRMSRIPLLIVAVLVCGAVVGVADASTSPEPGPSHASRVTGDRAAVASTTDPEARSSASVPPAKHVFVVNIENKGYDRTWGPDSEAPYLATKLRRKGVLLDHYYGTAHNSQSNYVAQVSGQGPNPDMQADCQIFDDFVQVTTVDPGQAVGVGCVFPAGVPTIASQMDAAGLRWRGYMDDMLEPCQHPDLNTRDQTQAATAEDNYATRHNPFAYFHDIIDRPAYCRRHVVPLTALPRDLRKPRRTPQLVYITPDLCNDGHDAPCADGRPGGLTSIDAWMKQWIPRILTSRAFRRDGVLVITADESDGPQSDATACCGETAVNTPLAGIVGAGGGRIGALVISRYAQPGGWSTTPYNHYSLLGSIEDVFGLDRIGYAAADDLDTFGLDVYGSGWDEQK